MICDQRQLRLDCGGGRARQIQLAANSWRSRATRVAVRGAVEPAQLAEGQKQFVDDRGVVIEAGQSLR